MDASTTEQVNTVNWVPILKQIAPGAPMAVQLAAALPAALDAAALNTPLRQAHFMAQVCYESGGFKRLSENLDYSAERIDVIFPRLKDRSETLAHKPKDLGNAAYAGRDGNGDEASGDGYRFRGRAYLQHTGRANYVALSAVLGVDLIENPDRLCEPALALQAATWFFKSRGCIPFADTNNATMITKRINGGNLGLADRRALTDRLLRLLGGIP